MGLPTTPEQKVKIQEAIRWIRFLSNGSSSMPTIFY